LLLVAACKPVAPPPVVTVVRPTAEKVPVTVEVTRLVTQVVVVTATPAPTPAPTAPTPLDQQAASLESFQGEAVVMALKAGDMNSLAEYMAPDGTLEFTALDLQPFGPDSPKYPAFNQEQVKALLKNKTPYIWTMYPEPLKLDFADYFSAHIFDLDYTNADRVLYNADAGLGYDNSELPQVSDSLILMEYVLDPPKMMGGKPYFSEGLILVFELSDDWYLTRILHDGWTP
jgi:hypothetical protein